MPDHCDQHDRYTVGCQDCYQARPQPPTGICPACRNKAQMQFREESDHDGPGNTTYAYMACLSCGIRSGEIIATAPGKEALVRDWNPSAERSMAMMRGEAAKAWHIGLAEDQRQKIASMPLDEVFCIGYMAALSGLVPP